MRESGVWLTPLPRIHPRSFYPFHDIMLYSVMFSCPGTVWSWGDGDYGKLGRGGSEGSKTPKVIDTLQSLGVVRVFCGAQFSAALTRDGTIWTWWDSTLEFVAEFQQNSLSEPLTLVYRFFCYCKHIHCHANLHSWFYFTVFSSYHLFKNPSKNIVLSLSWPHKRCACMHKLNAECMYVPQQHCIFKLLFALGAKGMAIALVKAPKTMFAIPKWLKHFMARELWILQWDPSIAWLLQKKVKFTAGGVMTRDS